MPFLHRYLGNPILSFLGRLFFQSKVGDFHCGLRGFNADRMRSLRLKSTGMEFASEMVVRASLAGFRIEEVPTTLSPDGRTRGPHLRTWPDGWRHLRFLLIYSPKWLFLYPGVALILLGLIALTLLMPGRVIIEGISLDIHSFVVAAMLVLLGLQAITFAVIARRYAMNSGLIPASPRYRDVLEWVSWNGCSSLGWCLALWGDRDLFGRCLLGRKRVLGRWSIPCALRILIVSMTAIAAAIQARSFVVSHGHFRHRDCSLVR